MAQGCRRWWAFLSQAGWFILKEYVTVTELDSGSWDLVRKEKYFRPVSPFLPAHGSACDPSHPVSHLLSVFKIRSENNFKNQYFYRYPPLTASERNLWDTSQFLILIQVVWALLQRTEARKEAWERQYLTDYKKGLRIKVLKYLLYL